MKKADRIYRLDNLLKNRRFITRQELGRALEVSRATLTRDIEFLRSQLNVPVIFDANVGGYRLDKSDTPGISHELPGLWFNETEIHALLAMESLLESIQPGLLAPHISPLKKRLAALLGNNQHAVEEIRKRILLLTSNPRRLKLAHFETCAAATLARKRLRLTYHERHRDIASEREVSPQRLVRYKENWYLDTWCHLRNAIRTFAVDALQDAAILEAPATDIATEELDAVLGTGYGIYAGKEVTWAELRFTPKQARWTAPEIWHPEQKSSFEPDGSYVLEVPYTLDGEIVMDILKFGPEVEVLAPESLRTEVARRLGKALDRYRYSSPSS